MKESLFTFVGSIVLAGLVFALIECGPKTDNNLSITVNPTQPIIIDQGSTLTLANGDTVTPPYFAINNFDVQWTSTSNSAQILALKFVITNPNSGSGTCAFSGNDIVTLFSSATYVDANGNTQPANLVNTSTGVVTIPAVCTASSPATCTTGVNYVPKYTTVGLIYCGGLTVTNTTGSNIYSSYNVPMAVALYGQTVDNTGDATGRLTAVTNITLQ